jgi:hypothetical protein
MEYCLLPKPKKIEYGRGKYTLPEKKLFVAASPAVVQELRPGLEDFVKDLEEFCGVEARGLVKAKPVDGHVNLFLNDAAGIGPEGYILDIKPSVITVQSGSCRGLYYGLQTLTQICKQSGRRPLSAVLITDEPELKLRGMMLDLRMQTYSMDYILRFIRTLAHYKINTLVIEYSDKFPYTGEYEVIRNKNCFSETDVKKIVQYCHDHFIEIIPFLQSFSHMEYILRSEKYRYLREVDQYDSQICPLHPDSLKVTGDLLQQIARLHRYSQHISIGGDEPYHLGKCARCSDYAAKYGKGGLYIYYVNELYKIAAGMGISTSTCSDKLMAYPYTLDLLNKNYTVFDWDYWTCDDEPVKVMNWNTLKAVNREEWEEASPEMRRFITETALDNEGKMIPFPYTKYLIENGFTVIGICSTASVGPDCYWVPQYDVHIPNIKAYCRNLKRYGGLGIINTAWERFLFELTYYGIIYGAEQCWSSSDIPVDDFNKRFVKLFFGIDDADLADWQYRISRPFSIVEKKFPMVYKLENYGRVTKTVFDTADNPDMKKNILGAAEAYQAAAEKVRWNRYNLKEWELGAQVKWFWFEVTRCYAEAARHPDDNLEEKIDYLDNLLKELRVKISGVLSSKMPKDIVEIKSNLFFALYDELREDMQNKNFRHTGTEN